MAIEFRMDSLRNALSIRGDIVQHSRRTFEHRGIVLEELLFIWNEKHRKVVWCRVPFESPVVDGEQNFCYHANFIGPFGTDAEEEARRRVKAEFDREHPDPRK